MYENSHEDFGRKGEGKSRQNLFGVVVQPSLLPTNIFAAKFSGYGNRQSNFTKLWFDFRPIPTYDRSPPIREVGFDNVYRIGASGNNHDINAEPDYEKFQ